MDWESQKKNLQDGLKNLEANFYYFSDDENIDIRQLVIDLEKKQENEDLSLIQSEYDKFITKLNRIKPIYQHPYYLIRPSTVVKLGDALRYALQLSSSPMSLYGMIDQLQSTGGYHQNLFNKYIDGTLSGVVTLSQSAPIRSYAFYGFSNITELSAAFTTGTGTNAFVGCNGLKKFYAPLASTYDRGFGSDPLTITEFTAGFNLEMISNSSKITYSAWGSTSKHLNPVFTKNSSIRMISLPGVYDIDTEAFASCTSLEKVYLTRPDLSVYSITEEAAKSAAASSSTTTGTSSSASVSAPLRTSTLLATSGIGQGAFKNCTALNYVSAPYFRFIKSNAFNGCTSLSEINMPRAASVQTKAFENCTSLVSVKLPMCNSLANDAFSKVTTLKYLELGIVSVPNIFNSQPLETVIMSSALKIAEKAFFERSTLKQVSFPLVQEIQASAFAKCSNIPAFIAPSMITIYKHAFSECSGLKFVNISNCTNIHEQAFYSCSQLQNIIMPNLTSISKNALQDCMELVNIYAPLCKSIGDDPFAGLGKLKYLCLGEDKTSESGFKGCKKVEWIHLPECTEIGAKTFHGYNFLNYISIPKCTKIGDEAFVEATHLSQIVLPKVSTIGKNVFQSCFGLKRVYLLNSSVTTLSSGAFDIGNQTYIDNLNFYVPTELLSLYQSHSTWTAYSHRLQAIGNAIDFNSVSIKDKDLDVCFTSTVFPNVSTFNEVGVGYEQHMKGFNLFVPFYKKEIKAIKDAKVKDNNIIDLTNTSKDIKYKKDETYFVIENIAVEVNGKYRMPKVNTIVFLDKDKHILTHDTNYKNSYINISNINYEFEIPQNCKFIIAMFKKEDIASEDVVLWSIKDYKHKAFYTIQGDNEKIIGPKFVYNDESYTYDTEDLVKYLYVSDDPDCMKTENVILNRITFNTPLNFSSMYQYFFIDEYRGSQYDNLIS